MARLFVGLFLVALALAGNEPLPVSLGEIMAKIEQGAPKDEILKAIESLQRTVSGEASTTEQTYTHFQTTVCQNKGFNDTIQASLATNASATVEIGKLRAHNQVIETDYMPKGEHNISVLEAQISEKQKEVKEQETIREAALKAFLAKKAELSAALKVIRDVKAIVDNSTLSNQYNLKSLLQSDGQAVAQASMRSTLEAQSKVATGFRKHLLSEALGLVSDNGDSVDKIRNLLDQMRNDFQTSLDRAIFEEEDSCKVYYQFVREANQGLLTTQVRDIKEAKVIMSQLMQEFANNDISAAQLSAQRTTAVGNAMIAYIQEADRGKRCAEQDAIHAAAMKHNADEVESLKVLHQQVSDMDLASNLAGVNVTSVIPAEAECYCDSMCGSKGDCCTSCEGGLVNTTDTTPTSQQAQP